MDLDFDTQTITRDIACPPAQLFALMTDAHARATWGAPDAESVIEIDHADIREGGHELARCGPKASPHFGTRMDFHVVDAPHRLIGTEALTVGGQMLSVALVSMEVAASDRGSRLSFTLQIASLSGSDIFADYRGGWSGALDNLERLATSETTT